jgi:hypothetical protein
MVVLDEKEPLLLEGAGQKVYSALVTDSKEVRLRNFVFYYF